MRIPVHTQTEKVAGGRRATSAQPRRAPAGVTPRLCSSQRPHPNSRVSATGATGAPHEGPLFAPLSARFQKLKRLVAKPSRKPGESR
jgi:hypothetical protein